MIDYESLKNKKFAYACLNLLKEKGALNEAVINILTNKEECKRIFYCSGFPVLLEVSLNGPEEYVECYDKRDKIRFYKEKIFINGRAFILSNHWYGPNKSMPDNRTPFLQWVLEKVK